MLRYQHSEAGEGGRGTAYQLADGLSSDRALEICRQVDIRLIGARSTQAYVGSGKGS